MIFLMISLQGTLMMIVIKVMVFTIMQYVITVTMTPIVDSCIEDREETLDIRVCVMLEETVGLVIIHISLI
jgi:hypothetical protein